MSTILEYIRGLAPSFKKNGVLASIEQTRHGIVETSLPAFLLAKDHFAANPLQSKEAKDWAAVYEKRVGKTQGGVVADVHAALENAVKILEHLEAQGKKIFSDTEANISLTYVKATYLRLVEAAEFASEYALKWLNQLYVFETANVDKQASVRDNISPAEQKWLEQNYFDFLSAVVVLHTAVKDIEKGVAGLPDATVTELSESTFPSTLGQSKVDPFNMRQFSAAMNPFYLIGLRQAEAQARRYKLKKAELELIQLRLLNLQKIAEKTPDARLQREIEYNANRVSGLAFEIQREEKEYLNG